MTRDTDKSEQDEARARQAKGSIQEAIGKIIGNAAVEQRGSQESEAGARQVEAGKAHRPKRPAPEKADKPIDTPIDRGGKD